jgi:hypothetical protein
MPAHGRPRAIGTRISGHLRSAAPASFRRLCLQRAWRRLGPESNRGVGPSGGHALWERVWSHGCPSSRRFAQGVCHSCWLYCRGRRFTGRIRYGTGPTSKLPPTGLPGPLRLHTSPRCAFAVNFLGIGPLAPPLHLSFLIRIPGFAAAFPTKTDAVPGMERPLPVRGAVHG